MSETSPKIKLFPPCPWPKDVWPMTEEEYVKAVPDPQTRTAISGFLMRRGWELAEEDIASRLGGFDDELKQSEKENEGLRVMHKAEMKMRMESERRATALEELVREQYSFYTIAGGHSSSCRSIYGMDCSCGWQHHIIQRRRYQKVLGITQSAMANEGKGE